MTDRDFDIERRPDGRLVVKIHSQPYRGTPLPDAVFTFRAGDPQFEQWEARYIALESARSSPRER